MSDSSLTIRVSRSTHELLRELSAKSNTTMTAVIDEAVRDLQRKKFWADFNAACEALQADPGRGLTFDERTRRGSNPRRWTRRGATVQ